MKIISIVISTLLLVATSCKKDNVTADHFQVTIGGTSFTFDSTYAIIDNGNPSAYFVSIFGKDTKTNNAFSINAQSAPKNAIAGTYSNTASIQGAVYNLLNANFIITSGLLAGSYRTNDQYTFTLTLDNPNNNRLQGSFAGRLELFPAANPGTPKSSDVITGEFKMPFKFIP